MKIEDKEVIEGEDYRGKDVFSFRELFLIQIRRCVNAGSKEMRQGYWVYSQSPNMTPQKIRYIGDAREEYVNSIVSLVDLTQPRFDEEAKKNIKELFEKEKREKENKRRKFEESSYDLKDDIKITWNIRRVEIYREIFREVCNFGERKRWFESEAGGE